MAKRMMAVDKRNLLAVNSGWKTMAVAHAQARIFSGELSRSDVLVCGGVCWAIDCDGCDGIEEVDGGELRWWSDSKNVGGEFRRNRWSR